jgi:diacylglycerol kinase family enzyme
VFGSTATHTLPNADTKDPNTRLLFEGEALLVAAVNAPKYGGWMRVSKETSISDGLLDLAVVRPGGVWKGGIMGPALAGSLATADRSRRVEVFRGTSFQIRCDAGPLCQIDGEPAPYLEAKVSVVANALRVKLGA